MRGLLALALAAALAAALPAAAVAKRHRQGPGEASSPSPSPSPAPTETPIEPPPVPPDPDFPEPEEPGFFDIVGKIKYAISTWFSNLVTAALKPVFKFLGQTVFSTPRLAGNERVVQFWGFAVGIADAILLLMVLVGAGLVTAGGGLQTQLAAKELLPRLLVAAIAANVSLILVGHLIELSNAISRGVLGASLTPGEVGKLMIKLLANAALGNPFLALLALATIVFGVLVVITYVIRVAALVVLLAAGPLVLITHALPQTERHAQAWWRAILAIVAAPVAQSLLLSAAARVLLTGDTILGLPIGSGFIDILVVGTLLYFLFKVPFWMLRVAFSGGAGARVALQIKQIGRAAAGKAVPA